MTDQLREKLAALRAVAPRLNAETDDTARVVKSVEEFLNGLSLGISAEVCFESVTTAMGDRSDGDYSRTDRDSYLRYGRPGGGAFNIHVLHKDSVIADVRDDDSAVHEAPGFFYLWPGCSREEKLKAFAVLPQLLQAITDKANRLAEKAAETRGTVQELLGALGEDEPGVPATPPLTADQAVYVKRQARQRPAKPDA